MPGRIVLADVPFVEGAVSAAVASGGGLPLAGVLAAAEEARGHRKLLSGRGTPPPATTSRARAVTLASTTSGRSRGPASQSATAGQVRAARVTVTAVAAEARGRSRRGRRAGT